VLGFGTFLLAECQRWTWRYIETSQECAFEKASDWTTFKEKLPEEMAKILIHSPGIDRTCRIAYFGSNRVDVIGGSVLDPKEIEDWYWQPVVPPTESDPYPARG
jgi:hypothetical protein